MSAGRTNAITISRTGGPEVLEYGEVDAPEPHAGEVALEIAAVGVNFVDIYERQGLYPRELPFVPGSEGAGRVVALGAGVVGVEVGDRVAWSSAPGGARARPGSYTELAAVPADLLLAVPDDVSDEQAAAIPLQGLTAHYLSHDCYRIAAGDTVLVHAGAGGVGLLLTQIAKLRGGRVITTVSSEAKAELSRAVGADEVLVGYEGFAEKVRELTGGEGAAAVYDGVGKDTFDGSLDALRVRGTMVLYGGASGQVPPFDIQRLNRGGSLLLTRPTLTHFMRTRDELLGRSRDLFGWLADGSLTIRIGASYPLADAARAHEDLAARRTTGKIVLTT